MLRSMTGFGEARLQAGDLTCVVEVRSVNHRFLKISTKIAESHVTLERDIERVVRERVRRGSVSVNVRLERVGGPKSYQINRPVVEGYLRQLREIVPDPSIWASAVLQLPGAVTEGMAAGSVETDGPTILVAMADALDRFEQTRRQEGAATREELALCVQAMRLAVDSIEKASPRAAEAYRARLADRLRNVLAEEGVTIEPADLVREVALFVERGDLHEELSRLRSHLVQFQETLDGTESEGRRLEFLSQEIYRESNTVGSKASDATIAELAIELKSQAERVREIVQNVE